MAKELSKVDIIEELDSNGFITVLLNSGKIAKIKKVDLFSIATPNNDGLMSAENSLYSNKLIETTDKSGIFKIAFAKTRQSTLSALINVMRVEGSLANLFYLQVAHANNGAINVAVVKLSIYGGGYANAVFYYNIEANGLISVYTSIPNYHTLTLTPLLVRNMVITPVLSDLPEGCTVIEQS